MSQDLAGLPNPRRARVKTTGCAQTEGLRISRRGEIAAPAPDVSVAILGGAGTHGFSHRLRMHQSGRGRRFSPGQHHQPCHGRYRLPRRAPQVMRGR